MSKPSLLLTPHSFGLPEFYNPVFDAVRAQGFDIRGLHLPSSGLGPLQGRPGEPPTMYDDADYIAREVEMLADAGKDVVLIAHSYSGVPASQCTRGLSKEERQRQGKPGGLVRMAFLSSPVPSLGNHGGTFREEVEPENLVHLEVEDDGWIGLRDPVPTARICFTSLPLEEGIAEAKKFSKQSAISFTTPVTYPGYKDVPCSFGFLEQDLCITPKVQQGVIDLIEKESGRKVDVTRIKSDHCAHITSRQATVDWIVGLGEKETLK